MPTTRLYLKSSGEPSDFGSSVDAHEALASGYYVTTPPAESSPLRATHTPAPETPAGRVQDMQARLRSAQGRLLVLREQPATDASLSDDEALEYLRVQSQIEHIGPVLARLEAEARTDAYKVNTAVVLDEWRDLLEAKQVAHYAIVAKLEELKAALDTLATVHQHQEECLSALPRPLLDRLNFPSVSELLYNMASRTPAPMGWSAVWCGPGGFVLPDPDALSGVDPGTKMLSQRLLSEYTKD